MEALPDMVVLHYTAMQTADGALRALSDPDREVSAHYLIGRNGTVWHLVDEAKRAWHAGAGQWGCTSDVNSKSIGIELDNDGVQPFSAPLMDALEELLAGILERWAIPVERVIGHSDMAPGRKIDPGARFDWQRLARQGLSIWPGAKDGASPDEREFRDFATQFGYAEDLSDALVLKAFRLRFRPGIAGPLDAVDKQIMRTLAQRYPVDRVDLIS